ncbi:MAG: hypothetical protein ABH807_02965 [Candidatus Shapirobacteria bacterium]
MKNAKTALVLTSRTGGGHVSAAQAYAYWLGRWGWQARVLDVLPAINGRITNLLYRVPKTYKQLFEISNNENIAQMMTASLRLEVERRLKKLAPDYRSADLVISTHPLLHPRRGRRKVMVLLDPVVHALYTVKPRPDYYFSFWPEVLPDIKRWGIRVAKVIQAGPLARPAFYHSPRLKLPPPPEYKLALVMAGSAWIHRAEVYLELFKNTFKNEKVIFVFMCGKNATFAREMTRKYRRYPNFKFLGWLNEEEVAAWMRLADFGLAFSLAQMGVEAGLCQLPIFILRLIEGQEDGYREVIENRGVGMFLPGDPVNQVALLKILYPHVKLLFGKNLAVWQKELLAAPNHLKKTLERLF